MAKIRTKRRRKGLETKAERDSRVVNIIGKIVLVTLLLSVIFALYRVIVTPEVLDGSAIGRHRSDYILMLLQCSLGLVVYFIPSFLERQFRIRIPNMMFVMYIIFLYCAIYLGEVQSFYYYIPGWDNILHAMSSMMLGSLGFSIVSLMNDSSKLKMQMNPVFIALFAFAFAVMIGSIWEIYEYTFDGLFHLNMQKFMDGYGVAYVGRAALQDTMSDIIVDVLGALTASLVGLFVITRKGGLKTGFSIEKTVDRPAENLVTDAGNEKTDDRSVVK